jgi:RNA polymerase sigma-70 factor (ECF subfamily)
MARSEADMLETIRREPGSAAARKAAGELLGRHNRNIYLWCYGFVRDHDHAMDLSQDVLMDALRGLPTFEGRSDLSLWLFVITRNRCRSALRRREPVVDNEFDVEYLSDRRANPERLLEEREAQDRLLVMMRDILEPVEQKALWLRCVDGMSVDDITDMLSIDNRSGARGVLQQARRKLRAAMQKDADEEAAS